MSLRDWFAGQYLVGVVMDRGHMLDPQTRAAFAYQQADAMIAERSKQ